MKLIFITLAFLSFMVSTPSFGQTSLQIARWTAFYNLGTGQINSSDSAEVTYNNQNLAIQTKLWQYQAATGNWDLKFRWTDFAYDANDKLLTHTFQAGNDVNGWVNDERYSYTYDANGNEIVYVKEKWDGANWTTQSTRNTVYDANGNKISSTTGNSRNLFSYNAQNLLETQTSQQNISNVWTDTDRIQYTYVPNDTKVATETHATWQASQWKENNRIVYSYDAGGNLTEELGQSPDVNGWKNDALTSHEYDVDGFETQDLFQIWIDTSWENNQRTLFEYDAAHNLVFWDNQNWASTAWEGGLRQFNGYDAESNWISARAEFWLGTWALFIIQRNYYAQFVSTQTPDFFGFEIFPNPATSFVTIVGDNLSQVIILDAKGRPVRMQRLESQEKTVHLNNLPAGNYYLQVLHADGKIGVKPLQILR